MRCNPPSQPTLAVACGGTGGHFYPGLTIAREFVRQGGRAVLFIAGPHCDEQVRIATAGGLMAVPVRAVRVPPSRLLFPGLALGVARAVWQSCVMVRRHGVDVALVMGSFAGVPLGLAAVLARKPLLIHEGNAVLGRANRMLSRWARVLALSFPLENGEPTAAEQTLTGMPLREAVLAAGRRETAAAERREICNDLGLDSERPILLVFGGSQGARAINDIIADALPAIAHDGDGVQLIHLTGTAGNAGPADQYREAGVRAHVADFDSRIERLLQIADFCICRAGGSTIAELALFGTPAIFIPLAAATDNHQRANALVAVEAKGGRVLEERDCTAGRISELVENWLDHPVERKAAGQNMRRIAHPNAAKDVVALIFEQCARVGFR